eukprot:scaffold7506_cov35-Attheya_sp.AAC.2
MDWNTLCPSSLVNTPYRYVQGLRSPARAGTECYARLPDKVMILEPSGTTEAPRKCTGTRSTYVLSLY